MISEKMEKAINEQINAELFSAYLYLSMSACFHAAGLDGMAHWMAVQEQEEKAHAMKFFKHIVDRQGRVKLAAIEAPQFEWASPLEAFEAAYKHEQYITGRINNLVKIAAEENDNAAGIMLQWFVTEQVEEEANTSKICDVLKRIGTSGNGLIMLDRQLEKRGE